MANVRIVGDAHVHIHPGFSLSRLLEAARRNLDQAAGWAGTSGPPLRILLLTESAGMDVFGELSAGRVTPPGWQVRPTDEPGSLLLTDSQGRDLILVAGRQVVSAENIEVLVLGAIRPWRDGQPLNELVDRALGAGCLAVLPWGAGKWIGHRGDLVTAMALGPRRPGLFLGDNGNRPWCWPRPRLFRTAARQGVADLPGSDPLPFARAEERVGRVGFTLTGELDSRTPWAGLYTLLRTLPQNAASLATFGSRERLLPFVRNQVAMQFIKRRGPGFPAFRT